MKITNTIKNAVLTFACLGTLFFTGCQNGLAYQELDDCEESENCSRAANGNLKIIAFEGGFSKLANIAANAASDGIENPALASLAGFGKKALNGAMKCLDGVLDFYTFGFYKGAISALWPDESNPSPELIAIQESISELQTSVSQISTDISNLSADLKQEFDAQKISERMQLIESTNASFEKLFTLIEMINTEESINYITYLNLRDYAIEAFGSVDKMRQAVQNYYTSFYSGNNVAVRSFGESYRLLSEELCPWRYQSSQMMETLIAQELNFGLRIFVISEMLLNVEESENISYDLKIQETIANCPSAFDLEKRIRLQITEVENHNEENAAIINEILDSYWENNSSRQQQFEMKEKIAMQAWNSLVEVFNKYVETINNIEIPCDKEGEITCNIRGVKYTFSKELKSVDYCNTLKRLANSKKDAKTEENWKNIFKTNRLPGETNTGCKEMLSAEQYQAIFNFYNKNGLKIVSEEQIMPNTLYNIFRYEAGIDFTGFEPSTNRFACFDSKEKTGFKITNERKDLGFVDDGMYKYDIDLLVLFDGLHFWNVSVPSIKINESSVKSENKLLLRDMAAAKSNKVEIERINYYKDSYVSNETFYFLNVIAKN